MQESLQSQLADLQASILQIPDKMPNLFSVEFKTRTHHKGVRALGITSPLLVIAGVIAAAAATGGALSIIGAGGVFLGAAGLEGHARLSSGEFSSTDLDSWV